ncbi:MAG: DUF4190 domain-containing protein [Sedimentisphaerales bacterium]|nr:DUF4190 domain-containing protein [Sedimentisphaerales bacterium]
MESEKNKNENPEKAKICRQAVLSFILAILCPFAILGILTPSVIIRNLSVLAPTIIALLAIDYGIVSLKEIKSSHGKLKGRGFALSGIVIAPILLSLLIMLFISALGKVKYIGWQITCGRHMNEIGKAMLIYVNEFDQYPTAENWCDLLIKECNVPPDEFCCPIVEKGPCNYALNKNIAELGEIADPDIVVFFETHPGWNQIGGPEILTTDNHEGRGCNVVFLDGHVKFVETKDIPKLKWKSD